MKTAALLAILCISFRTAFATSGKLQPLKDRVCEAEIIAVGSLSDIHERQFWVNYPIGDLTSVVYYDFGHLQDCRFLKNHGLKECRITVLFPSKKNPGPRLSGHLQPHEVGDSGIWRLRRDYFSGAWLVLEPGNPLTDEAEITKLIHENKCEK